MILFLSIYLNIYPHNTNSNDNSTTSSLFFSDILYNQDVSSFLYYLLSNKLNATIFIKYFHSSQTFNFYYFFNSIILNLSFQQSERSYSSFINTFSYKEDDKYKPRFQNIYLFLSTLKSDKLLLIYFSNFLASFHNNKLSNLFTIINHYPNNLPENTFSKILSNFLQFSSFYEFKKFYFSKIFLH
jgi:hypothetical protein